MYNTNKIDTILFDMDGTVLASEELFGIAELKLLRGYGVHAELKDLIEFRGTSENEFYPLFIRKFNLNDNPIQIKKRLKAILFDTFKDSLEYINGFKEFYSEIVLRHNIKTALVTNTSLEIVNHIRKCIDLDDYFEIYITASDVSEPKPSPVPYLNAMRAAQSRSGDTVIIEDSTSGLISALSSECEVIALTTTLTSKQIGDISPKITACSNYKEIKKFLEDRV